MSRSLSNAVQSLEVRLPEKTGPRRAKAELKSPTPSDFGYGPRIWDCIVRGHGSVKATALTMGGKDESLIRRQITEGTIRLREFHEADEAALCEYAEWVLDTFKPARKSKAELALEQLPAMFQMTIDALLEKK